MEGGGVINNRCTSPIIIVINRWSQITLIGIFFLILLVLSSCSKGADIADIEKQRRGNFNKNFEVFQKLEEMQREDLSVFAISATRIMSFKEAKGLKEAINNGYTYKQNNIDRYKNVDGHKFHYQFKSNEGLTKEKWSEYKNLLARAGFVNLIYEYDRPDKRQVWFNPENINNSGYVYMEYPPPIFFQSYKDCKPIMPSESCYIFLRENWYLYWERFRLEQD